MVWLCSSWRNPTSETYWFKSTLRRRKALVGLMRAGTSIRAVRDSMQTPQLTFER
jgi:hypothetical protein